MHIINTFIYSIDFFYFSSVSVNIESTVLWFFLTIVSENILINSTLRTVLFGKKAVRFAQASYTVLI